jgi:hypothetical protein
MMQLGQYLSAANITHGSQMASRLVPTSDETKRASCDHPSFSHIGPAVMPKLGIRVSAYDFEEPN